MMDSSTRKSPASYWAGRLLASAIGLTLAFAVALTPRPTSAQGQKTQNPPAQGQQQQGGFKIGVEVNMVTVPVTVRRPEGGFVKDLPKSAFRITEDGEEQEILTFSQEGLPTYISIVLDTSGSVHSEWSTIKYATKRFVENLKPEDKFSLVAFNEETRLKMDWGNVTGKLEEVLSSFYPKGNTNLWDAIYLVAGDTFKGIREKKAMILMTDGLDTSSAVTYKEALETAVHSEAAVYIVSKTQAVRQAMLAYQSQGVYAGIPEEVFMQADLALRKLSYETGGRVLYPNSFGQLDDIYAQVNEELRNQYTLGYLSTNSTKDGSYRRIEVGVNAPRALVSARPGYYAPTR